MDKMRDSEEDLSKIKHEIQGRRIAYIRQIRGYKQNEAAKKAGITPQLLQGYEAGTRHPKDSQLQKIADALDVPIELLQPRGVMTIQEILALCFDLHQSYHGLTIQDDGEDISIRLSRKSFAYFTVGTYRKIMKALDSVDEAALDEAYRQTPEKFFKKLFQDELMDGFPRSDYEAIMVSDSSDPYERDEFRAYIQQKLLVELWDEMKQYSYSVPNEEDTEDIKEDFWYKHYNDLVQTDSLHLYRTVECIKEGDGFYLHRRYAAVCGAYNNGFHVVRANETGDVVDYTVLCYGNILKGEALDENSAEFRLLI